MRYLQVAIVLWLSVQVSSAWGQNIPLIKKLTSKTVAEKVEKNIPQEAKKSSQNNIPNELKVHSLGVGLGQTFVKGSLGRYGQDKITADIFYNYSVSYSFDLMLNLHYSKHTFSHQYTKLQGATVGIKGKFYEFDSFHPFVLGGFGFYGPQVKNEVIESPSKVVFGIHAGGGGELILNRKFSLGLLAHYHNPFDISHEMGPDVEGFYFKLLVMTFYRF